MDKIKSFFKSIGDNTIGAYGNAKEMFKSDRRTFCEVATKGSFGILFIFGLILPLFSVRNVFGTVTLRFNGFDMPGGWFWILAFLVLVLVTAGMGFNKEEKSKKLFKISTIVFIVFFVWLFLNYIVAALDSSLPTVNISFGFFLVFIALVAIIILTWKPALLMDPILKIFVKEEPAVLEPVPSEEPTPEVEPVPEVKEEEPAPVEEVKEEKPVETEPEPEVVEEVAPLEEPVAEEKPEKE